MCIGTSENPKNDEHETIRNIFLRQAEERRQKNLTATKEQKPSTPQMFWARPFLIVLALFFLIGVFAWFCGWAIEAYSEINWAVFPF